MKEDSIIFTRGIIEDDNDSSDFLHFLSQEDDEEMNKEALPDVLPILPLRNTVLFPGVLIPITVGRDKSIKLIKDANKGDKIIGVVSQRDSNVEDPNYNDLNKVGTVAKILKMLRMPDGNTTVIIQGKRRFLLGECQVIEPYIRAKVSPLTEQKIVMDEETTALISSVKDLSGQIIELSPNIPSEAAFALKHIKSPLFLVSFISSNLNVDVKDKQTLLEIVDFKERTNKVLEFLTKELQYLQLKNEIQSKVKTDLDKQQRDFFLQQQIRAIQEELGQDSPDKEIGSLRLRGSQKKWPKHILEAFNKELDKLLRMNPMMPDHSISLNYAQTLLDLPWHEYTKDNFDLERARIVLDQDHFGMEKVKERILEYLAVLKLKGDLKSPILCLYGPPGVGKTSLGKSIARALGRKYVRVSLGGLHDEAEIRGHRKTYIGAMPGRIIQNLKKAKSGNPVFVLDEIDKVGSDFRGDPSSALLEVLDPEQNSTFYDNYLELEYDLSNVMFVATANSLDTIQPALLDRMEVIDINGYTIEEKVEIAKKYLIPKQRKFHGLKAKEFGLNEKAITKVVEDYTRESGVRGLEKKISALARSVAKSIVMEDTYSKILNEADVLRILGSERMEKEIYQDNDVAGVVTGLAWTPVGGEILFVESSLIPGKGKMTLTGKLGDVMKESAMTALTFLKSHCEYLNIEPDTFDNYDIHIHVPAGAVPKDGPSAGVTMLTSLASLFTQRKVKPFLAMTGEITLRGKILPVGGIKEKILAARRAGIKEIILCEQNRKDIDDIKPAYLVDLTFHFVKNMLQVLDLSLMDEKVPKPMKLIRTGKDKGEMMKIQS